MISSLSINRPATHETAKKHNHPIIRLLSRGHLTAHSFVVGRGRYFLRAPPSTVSCSEDSTLASFPCGEATGPRIGGSGIAYSRDLASDPVSSLPILRQYGGLRQLIYLYV